MGAFVGIDLGTTYSAVAFINAQGKPEIIPNEFGRNTTPSVVAFEAGKAIVGEEAKRRQASGDMEVAAFFKRSMGDPDYVHFCGEIEYKAKDLSRIVLQYVKEQAELFLKTEVTDAVITVPAYFKHTQRMDTIEAGREAGLNVLKIVNEPTAAALAYGIRPDLPHKKQSVLVYDLGGGTFDVSLVELSSTELIVKATDGDHELGGKDWDDRLINYLEDKFLHDCGREIVGDDMTALRLEVEKLKYKLTAHFSGQIRVQANRNTEIYAVKRELFEDLTRDLMERTWARVEKVLAEAHRTWNDIDGVLPVGGSTRMPMVQSYIKRMSKKAPMGGINPDEAVALGAAIQAAMEMEEIGEGNLVISGRKRTKDVIAHSLGMIAISKDGTKYINSILIPKNRNIPSEQKRPFTLPIARQGYNQLEIFLTQGESTNPQECIYLGRYVFDNFPFLPGEKKVTIDVTYQYDKNATVNITAVEHSTGTLLHREHFPIQPDIPARFRESPKSHRRPQEHVNIYLAFDLSGSMRGAPLAAAKQATEEFVRQCDLAYTSIGLIAFSDDVSVDLPATQDIQEIQQGIRRLTVGNTGWGNGAQPFTDIYDHLGNRAGTNYAVILTDGRWVCWKEAISEAKRCHKANIQITAIGFGKARPDFLFSIASSSEQGRFIDIQNLTETYSTIAQEINADADRRSGSKMYFAEE